MFQKFGGCWTSKISMLCLCHCQTMLVCKFSVIFRLIFEVFQAGGGSLLDADGSRDALYKLQNSPVKRYALSKT